ncbi:MAG: efflux RND transporter permease subunit [Candidatus Omnitrophota bacterium]|nr:efflux RND transporter permease subunit [Candidatus Omnitrophota bacterium]
MNLTEIFIKKNRVTFTLLILFVLGGIQAYINFPRNEDPEITIRQAMVMTANPGMKAEEMELLVSDKLEKKIQELPELRYVESENRYGVSLITVDIKQEYYDMPPIWERLRNKVSDVVEELPEGTSTPIVWDDYGDVFGIVVAITGDGFSYKEIEDVADDLKKELLLLPDIAKVELYGVQERRIFVEISNARLAAFGLTPEELLGLLADENVILPGGHIFIGPEKIVIQPTGNYLSVDDIKMTVVSSPGEVNVVYLKDIAEVKSGYIEPPHRMMRRNGIQAIAVAVNMKKGGNIIELGGTMHDFIKGYIKKLPVGINIEIVNYMPEKVIKATNDFMFNLVQAILIVCIVMILSLGVRTGVIVASLIPMSVLAAFVFMGVFGIHLHRVSIASLIIALGLMVDCGIVMSENIMVLQKKGVGRLKASIESGKELMIPLLTSTLTTCAAFLPVGTAKSVVGEYCISMFQVVSITLLCSWFMGLTMIPLLCFYFLRFDQKENPIFKNRSFRLAMIALLYIVSIFVAKLPIIILIVAIPFFYRSFLQEKSKEKELNAADTGKSEFDNPFYKKYLQFLSFVLMNRKKALIWILALFVFALWMFGFVRKIFFPPSDRPQFYVNFDMPEGSSIYTTSDELKKLEKFLVEQKEVESVAAYIGEGGPRFLLQFTPEQAKENYAYVLINCRKYADVVPMIKKTRAFIAENIPYGNPVVRQLESGAPVGYPVQIRLSGDNIDTLYEMADQVKGMLNDMPGPINIKDDWGVKTKKIALGVDQAKAKRLGLSSRDIANSLQMLMDEMSSTAYREKDKEIPIALRAPEAERSDVGKLEAMAVYSQSSGESIPVSQVAKEELIWENSKIFRRNRWRTMTVECELQPGYGATQILDKLVPMLDEAKRSWPSGYKYELGGEFEESARAQNSIIEQLPMAAFFILMLMVIQFNSIRRTLIIVSTIPMAMIGVTVGLLITDIPFGFMALLGYISLAGIVINNAIVLIDRIDINIREGNTSQKSIIMAALSRTRPIILTSITTVGGLVPLALGGGEFWAPMAVTIMSGLIFSTVLTLGFVPMLYSMFFKVNYEENDFQLA